MGHDQASLYRSVLEGVAYGFRHHVDVTPEQLLRTLSVNLAGVLVCGQAAAREMIAAGRPGRIVNIASMAGKQGRVSYLSNYVASQFGVVGLTQAMGFDLAAHTITVIRDRGRRGQGAERKPDQIAFDTGKSSSRAS